jgi:lipopolysaccharide transport system ATP-binding protein
MDSLLPTSHPYYGRSGVGAWRADLCTHHQIPRPALLGPVRCIASYVRYPGNLPGLIHPGEIPASDQSQPHDSHRRNLSLRLPRRRRHLPLGSGVQLCLYGNHRLPRLGGLQPRRSQFYGYSMSKLVISVENLSKSYQLGQIDTGTFSNDLKVWWARMRGKPNPLLRIGETDHGNRVGEELWALKDVSFQVEQGEVLGIIGRNGAGKSTLLKILSRVTAPTIGSVKVKGRIASLLEVGTGFHPELTGQENIYLNGAILGMTKKEVSKILDNIINFAEIEKFIDTPVKRYSSGMYVRLAFSVAAHLNSEILIVDEVLAVGDSEFQKKCLGKMSDVSSKEGRTVIFVSHNMNSIEFLCNKGMVIVNGINHFSGLPSEAIQFYQNNYLMKTGMNNYGSNVIFQNDAIKKGYSITKIEVLDELGNPSTMIYTWDKIIFRIHYFADQENAMGSAVIKISTTNHEPLLLMSSKPGINMPMKIKAGNHFVDCLIDSIPLAAGKYILGAGLAVPNIEWLFWEQELTQIEIHQKDVYESGFPPNAHDGLIAPKYSWRTY